MCLLKLLLISVTITILFMVHVRRTFQERFDGERTGIWGLQTVLY